MSEVKIVKTSRAAILRSSACTPIYRAMRNLKRGQSVQITQSIRQAMSGINAYSGRRFRSYKDNGKLFLTVDD